MKNCNRKMTYIPIKIWIKLDMLSKNLSISKVQTLDDALTLLKEKIYENNPNTKLFKDYLDESIESINTYKAKIEMLEKKIDFLNQTLIQVIKNQDK